MANLLESILAPGGAVSRRLGAAYEFRPQQLEMARAVERSLNEPSHLLVEAGTGVGKSFAYLLPAIDFAVKKRKRVVISTHTISLQEQLIEKDIPLLQSVYPDEFTAILVKGRGNYLCLRRLDQTMRRSASLFDFVGQQDSLRTIAHWAQTTMDGSLSDLPDRPESSVWDKVCAEHGNCLGKRCDFYDKCHWQAARKRMQGGRILIVNHALFFSDLSLRASGINYLPRYDAAVLDEAHTIEDVAGEHFGMEITESGLRYQLRALWDPSRQKGLLSVHGPYASKTIEAVDELHEMVTRFAGRVLAWRTEHGRANGRIHEPNWIDNDLSPKLRDLSLHLRAMVAEIDSPEEVSEITAIADKVASQAAMLNAIIAHEVPEAVYWMETGSLARPRVSLNAAPISAAEGLRSYLFEKVQSVIMTSATLCTRAAMGQTRVGMMECQNDGAGAHPSTQNRNGESGGTPNPIHSVILRLADALPSESLEAWRTQREAIMAGAKGERRTLSRDEVRQIADLHGQTIEQVLDAGHGSCALRRREIAQSLQQHIQLGGGKLYRLLAWCIMPNHVHVVFKPIGRFGLPQILHSWTAPTAREAEAILRRRGDFWQREHHDHVVSGPADLHHCISQVMRDPHEAGLRGWKFVGRNDAEIALVGGESPGDEPAAPAAEPAEAPAEPAEAPAPAASGAEAAEDAFAYIKWRLGVEKVHTLLLGSPFNYAEQATLFVESDLPEPNDPLFLSAACEKILDYLKLTSGGAFVLFTSYSMLNQAVERLRPELSRLSLPLLVHGEGMQRRTLLGKFRKTPNAVLFGTASFWQGIDVQGDQLRNVILVKLPFAVPDEPLIEARLEEIRRTGGNPFMEYSVPEAIIKLKQGFGRLIRSRTDRGIVVILDSRVKTKRYGKLFMASLPRCKVGKL